MFVTEATALLGHPLPAVAAVVGRAGALPRWCRGVRRLRDDDGRRALVYVARDVRLPLAEHTVERAGAGAGGAIVHALRGDGVTIEWRLALDDDPVPGVGPGVRTRLHARTTLAIADGHPLAAHRTALARHVARRAPIDLARLAELLDRRAFDRRAPERHATTR